MGELKALHLKGLVVRGGVGGVQVGLQEGFGSPTLHSMHAETPPRKPHIAHLRRHPKP